MKQQSVTKLFKKKTNFKALSLSFLLAFGISCSDDEGIILETETSSKSSKSIELTYTSLTTTTEQSENSIENIDDNSLETRWSGEGTSVNVDIDFGQEVTVDYLNIAFHNGNERTSKFSYWESNNGDSWVKIGGKTSSGDTEDFEEFDLRNITARFLRIEFQGNSINDWNSVLELEIYGTLGEDTTPIDDNYINIPAKIEAENFTEATEGRTETTNDIDGELNIGWIDADEYLLYNINVPVSGEYNIDFRVASRSTGTNFEIYQGNSLIGSISSQATGDWQTWETVVTKVSLDAGEQTLKIVATDNGWNINWFEIKSSETSSEDEFGPLDPNKYPSENFDLSDWKITLSSGDDIPVHILNGDYEYKNQFYTASDGGMVFKNYPLGAGTTTNSTYSRVELREMLRKENENIPTQGINENNWVFDSSSTENQNLAGGIGGKMTATLAVNRVTTTSSSDTQEGRIVIGQIHASDHEPIRLYYKKMNDHTNGAIYFVHEDSNQNEIAVNMIGDDYVKTANGVAGDYNNGSNPSNGIPLGEVFSYKIEVIGTMLYVDIYRNNAEDVSASYDMSNSGFANDYMYFKAGLYSQNKTVQDTNDYEQVTFYALENSHN